MQQILPKGRLTKDQRALLAKIFNLRILYLFTVSDIKTIIVPCSLFGLIASSFGQIVEPEISLFSWIGLSRIPVVVFWLWLNLLPIDINNQSAPGSVEEDNINKSWRALPSGLITTEQARAVMTFWYIVAVIVSWMLGALSESLILIGLGFWYNVYGGANTNWMIRNILNTLGYLTFFAGAITVAAHNSNWTTTGYLWFLITGLAMVTTIQIQDLADQIGDLVKGRQTMPLVYGEDLCRIWSAFTVLFWTFLVKEFWQIPANSYPIHLLIGAIVALRCLSFRSVASDKMTYTIYNVWIASIFVAPLLS